MKKEKIALCISRERAPPAITLLAIFELSDPITDAKRCSDAILHVVPILPTLDRVLQSIERTRLRADLAFIRRIGTIRVEGG